MKKNNGKTKLEISESFISLLNSNSFDKITIKMIADNAGVIRPTFYNYFQDKYKLIEWILETQIFDSAQKLADNNMPKESIIMVIKIIENNRSFYKKLFKIEGQQPFSKIFTNKLYILLLSIIKDMEITEFPEKKL